MHDATTAGDRKLIDCLYSATDPTISRKIIILVNGREIIRCNSKDLNINILASNLLYATPTHVSYDVPNTFYYYID